MKNNITMFGRAKHNHQKITMVTAYDYTSAKLVDQAGIDAILVGDSLGNVILGHENVLPVTVADMIHHGQAVVKGAATAFVVVDMPFMSYQVSIEEAVRNAGAIIKATNANAVKLEGGREMADRIAAIVAAGIPVMAHLGLTPQSFNVLGGYKVQGKQIDQAAKLLEDAKAVEAAGAFAVVLECIPAQLSQLITTQIAIATIGIGSGPACDGQVLVFHDLLGLNPDFKPKFVKTYLEGANLIHEAVATFASEVSSGAFPTPEHQFKINHEVLRALEAPEE